MLVGKGESLLGGRGEELLKGTTWKGQIHFLFFLQFTSSGHLPSFVVTIESMDLGNDAPPLQPPTVKGRVLRTKRPPAAEIATQMSPIQSRDSNQKKEYPLEGKKEITPKHYFPQPGFVLSSFLSPYPLLYLHPGDSNLHATSLFLPFLSFVWAQEAHHDDGHPPDGQEIQGLDLTTRRQGERSRRSRRSRRRSGPSGPLTCLVLGGVL